MCTIQDIEQFNKIQLASAIACGARKYACRCGKLSADIISMNTPFAPLETLHACYDKQDFTYTEKELTTMWLQARFPRIAPLQVLHELSLAIPSDLYSFVDPIVCLASSVRTTQNTLPVKMNVISFVCHIVHCTPNLPLNILSLILEHAQYVTSGNNTNYLLSVFKTKSIAYFKACLSNT